MMAQLKNKIQTFSEYTLFARRMTRYVWAFSGALFALYLYFVGAITFSVIERQGLEESTKTLISDISAQELRYLEEEKVLTKEFAYSIGLVDAPTIAFTEAHRSFASNGTR